MKRAAWAGFVLLVAVAGQPAAGGTWWVPMWEQVPGGFDYIHIRRLASGAGT